MLADSDSYMIFKWTMEHIELADFHAGNSGSTLAMRTILSSCLDTIQLTGMLLGWIRLGILLEF